MKSSLQILKKMNFDKVKYLVNFVSTNTSDEDIEVCGLFRTEVQQNYGIVRAFLRINKLI